MATSFPFLYLPTKLRLQIWEHTWPAPRLIRITSSVTHRSNNSWGVKRLQPMWDLAWWLKLDPDRRWPYQPITSLPPDQEQFVALYVCSESRRHTLKSYRRIHHYLCPEWSFHLSPHRDLLALHPSEDVGGSVRDDLWDVYGRQLGCFNNAMMFIHPILILDQWDMEIWQLLAGVDIVYFTSEYLQDLSGNWTDNNLRRIRYEAAEMLAGELRRRWGIGGGNRQRLLS
ncbi:hypothetical protein NM208_g2946 [Fusarium decemcellulare]|uniref:Uncharacterized protein n=1 Tax=Fusarium decemcellulare TaxID=57161 RepID=A0ACC1SQZ2_9HYPO|nr:hypothetical protein NM208_g2946 [Fusarium decemcellulare]